MRIRRVSNLLPATALWDRVDEATPAQLRRSFVHRGEAHACAPLFGDADPIIDDLKHHIPINGESHEARPCPGMTHHVGKRLLRDTVDGHLDGCWEVGKVLGRLY
jgi:hypothetical protein